MLYPLKNQDPHIDAEVTYWGRRRWWSPFLELLWSTLGWTVWMIKNSCLEVSNTWVLIPAQSISTSMALEESSDIPKPQFSCSVEWGCQSLHQRIAVKIWWSDECRLPWNAQLMSIRTCIIVVLYVFWVGHSGSLVILLSHTYPSSFLHHSPRITLLCLYQYSSHKYTRFQVYNLPFLYQPEFIFLVL